MTHQFLPKPTLEYIDSFDERKTIILLNTLFELTKGSLKGRDFDTKLATYIHILGYFAEVLVIKQEIVDVFINNLSIPTMLDFATKARKPEFSDEISLFLENASKINETFGYLCLGQCKQFAKKRIQKNSGNGWFIAILRCKLCQILSQKEDFAAIYLETKNQHQQCSDLRNSPDLFNYWLSHPEENKEQYISAAFTLFDGAKMSETTKTERKFFKTYLEFVDPSLLKPSLGTIITVSTFDPTRPIPKQYIDNMKKAYFIVKSHNELRKDILEKRPSPEMILKIKQNRKLAKYINTIFDMSI